MCIRLGAEVKVRIYSSHSKAHPFAYEVSGQVRHSIKMEKDEHTAVRCKQVHIGFLRHITSPLVCWPLTVEAATTERMSSEVEHKCFVLY